MSCSLSKVFLLCAWLGELLKVPPFTSSAPLCFPRRRREGWSLPIPSPYTIRYGTGDILLPSFSPFLPGQSPASLGSSSRLFIFLRPLPNPTTSFLRWGNRIAPGFQRPHHIFQPVCVSVFLPPGHDPRGVCNRTAIETTSPGAELSA